MIEGIMLDLGKLQEYIEAIAGEKIALRPFDSLKKLPLYLCGYQFFSGEFNSVQYIFACSGKQDLTPVQYLNHWKALQNLLNAKVIFVFEVLPAVRRNRLFQLGLPFIVPGHQFYLPPYINFVERQRREPFISKFLLYPAQLLVIREILLHDVSGVIQKDLALKTGYTAMSISSAIESLEQAGLCRIERKWKERFVYFLLQGHDLWEKALPMMRSPVRKRVFNALNPGRLPFAGVSALSLLSMMNPDLLPIYAVSFRKEDKNIVVVDHVEVAKCVIEIWQYAPIIISNNCVDPLSLFLSMKNDDDPRIQSCLQEMMEKIRW